MHYKVMLVHQKSSCCSTTPIAGEIESACNRMASAGYVLVTAYQQTASVQMGACNQQSETGAVLVFARHT
tara:strand:- start:287 stop:496 length:210 start_codon:yes stop_codon:yes gene_type:complete